MTATQKLRASTMKWCDRNSRPKSSIPTPAVRPEPTRWQKPGPMSRNEWANFYKTYQVDTMVHNERLQGGKQKRDSKPIVEKPSVAEVIPLRENPYRLSMPRWQRQKYIPPPPEQFPYRPQIIGQSAPPRPEHGRPVQRPVVPCCFQHVDLENEFWSNLRFPVSRKALTARPSKKIYELARPRQYPQKCHCSVPNNEEEVPKRRKMSPREWRHHLQRLEFLSKPNPRVLADLLCCCH
ncbi:uncharacterized protein LOC6727462 [Drosophila simulans]|uniref:GD20116 n=1 Tax=Drosophila simulans TaxID=7240 RepID=B4QTE3_DROSI|nr:uncharacterized protein LOC6727462 [Drosophila simulans]EDX12345.1 GD20116 [Drosophila simulans]KMZ02670.1 uncharacterized protein Dsimw501_GD20116 [Drosophila simulans]